MSFFHIYSFGKITVLGMYIAKKTANTWSTDYQPTTSRRAFSNWFPNESRRDVQNLGMKRRQKKIQTQLMTNCVQEPEKTDKKYKNN